MRLKLKAGLRYPITVTKLLKPLSSDVEQGEPIFSFSYTTKIKQDDIEGDGESYEVDTLYHSKFESEIEGSLKKWLVRERQIINQPIDVAEIEEACDHASQFAGLCLQCGKATEWSDYNTTKKAADRATVNMLHDNTLLKVAPSEAVKAENETKRRLVKARKLSLVVDLDQTVIHAVTDPTVAEWQADPTSPNYDAVQDVVSFNLKDDFGREQAYYVKLRPGLQHFLETVSQLYELHIYTMGTRSYAEAVAKIIDPDKRFFSDRILSRDENGSVQHKSLHRLFPTDQRMVVIIDDRADVWSWSKSLLRVAKYVFWPEIGDINASFLPPVAKTVSLPVFDSPASEGKNASNSTNGSANGHGTMLEKLAGMDDAESQADLKKKSEKAAQLVEAQVKERPLAQQQAALDEKDESGTDEGGNTDGHRRVSLLTNTNDCELKYVEEGLRRVHTKFFDEYNQNMAEANGGRLGELRGSAKAAKPSDTLDLEMLPDIQEVMPYIKESVLGDVSAVFSGVFEMGTDVFKQDMVVWANEFGLTVRENLRKSTTHLIAARTGSAKVKLALRQGKGKIKIVSTRWLMDSIQQWSKQDEAKYMLHSEDDYIEPIDDRTGIQDLEEGLLSDSGEPVDGHITDGDATDTERARPVLRKLGTKSRKSSVEAELEPDTDEEHEPESPFDNKSPIGGDEVTWEGIDDDLAEFLDDSDSETESEASRRTDGSRTPLAASQGNKRRLEEMGEQAADDGPRKRPRGPESEKGETNGDDEGEDWDPEALWSEAEEEEEEERKRHSAENSPEIKETAAFSDTKGDDQPAPGAKAVPKAEADAISQSSSAS